MSLAEKDLLFCAQRRGGAKRIPLRLPTAGRSWRLCAIISFFTQILKEKNADKSLGRKKNLLVPRGGRFIVLRAKTRRRKENSFAPAYRRQVLAALRDYFFFLLPLRRTRRKEK